MHTRGTSARLQRMSCHPFMWPRDIGVGPRVALFNGIFKRSKLKVITGQEPRLHWIFLNGTASKLQNLQFLLQWVREVVSIAQKRMFGWCQEGYPVGLSNLSSSLLLLPPCLHCQHLKKKRIWFLSNSDFIYFKCNCCFCKGVGRGCPYEYYLWVVSGLWWTLETLVPAKQ